MKKIIVGVRGSKLSLTQSMWVLEAIKKKHPNFIYDIKIINTSGDFDQKTAIDQVKNKDFFTDNIQKALLNNEIDMAIHSMKDLSVNMPKELMLSKVPKREDPRDVLVINETFERIDEIPEAMKIGTSSQKRSVLIQEVLKRSKVSSIRGNVDQRVKKVKAGQYDGTVLAAAGLKRLKMNHVIDFYFDPKIFIPAPAQGILALQMRKEDKELLEIANSISHKESNIQYQVERGFYNLSAGKYPIIGGYCEVDGDSFELFAMLGSADNYIKRRKKGNVKKYKKLVNELFIEMSEALANEK